MKNAYHPQTVTHPKEFLIEALEERELSVEEFALQIQQSEKDIYKIINDNLSISTEIAIQFEKALQIPASFWLECQRLYDECQIRINSSNKK